MITILGQGSFGHAWTLYLDKILPSTHNLHVWDTRKELVQHLQNHNKHPEFNQETSQRVKPVQKLSSLPKNDVIVLAVSSQGVQPVLKQLQNKIHNKTTVFNTAKGLSDQGTFFSEIIQDYILKEQYGVIMGATKAERLRNNAFCAMTLAHSSDTICETYKDVFSSQNVVVKTTQDVKSAEIAGVTKNILSLLYGYLVGAQYTSTEREYIFTKTMKDVEKTVPGLTQEALRPCWHVDILMSSHSKTRNKELGIRIGKKGSVKEDATVEGWESLQKLKQNAVLKRINALSLLYELLITEKISREAYKQKMLQ